ncbi:MAG: Uma2 family endonuclease [Fimbriiglobus sp.]
MIMQLRRPTFTADEFERMPGMDGYELLDGNPREKHVGNESGWVGGRILRSLGNVVDADHLGWASGSDAGFACFPHRPGLVRKPDVSFVARGRYPGDRPPRGYARIAPDFVVEVASPNEEAEELEAKVRDYKAAGVPLIWVVYPITRTAYAHRADGSVQWVAADGELSAAPVVPGFRLRLADVLPPDSADPTGETP